jgi:hypothetical protein
MKPQPTPTHNPVTCPKCGAPIPVRKPRGTVFKIRLARALARHNHEAHR